MLTSFCVEGEGLKRDQLCSVEILFQEESVLKGKDITKGRKFLNCVSSTQGKLLLRMEGKKREGKRQGES